MGNINAHKYRLYVHIYYVVCNNILSMDRDRLSIQISRADEEAKGKKGVSLYLVKDKAYTFIETVPAQRFQIKCALTTRTPKPAKIIEEEPIIPDGVSSYIDILHDY